MTSKLLLDNIDRKVVRCDLEAWKRDELPLVPIAYGTNRIVVPGTKGHPTRVYIDTDDTEPEITDLDIARAYIKLQCDRAATRQPHYSAERQADALSLSPPTYESDEEYRHAVEIDLVSAYWTIWSRVPSIFGWTENGKVRWRLDIPLYRPQLLENEPARNVLVGMLIATTQTVWHYGEQTCRPCQPSSPGLWAYIMSVLHRCCDMAIDCGAYSVKYDSYILPRRTAPEFMVWLRQDAIPGLGGFGLHWRETI